MRHDRYAFAVLAALFLAILTVPVFGSWGFGATGYAKIFDNTQNGIGPGDPRIGDVFFTQVDATTLRIKIVLFGGVGVVGRARLEVSLVTVGTSTDGGITGEPGGHYGGINVIGFIFTGNSGYGRGEYVVDLGTLWGTVDDVMNYGHIDIEDDSGAVTPGILDYGLVMNQYGATRLEWLQP